MNKKQRYLRHRRAMNHWMNLLEGSFKKDVLEILREEGPMDLTTTYFGQNPYRFHSVCEDLYCHRAYLDDNGILCVDAGTEEEDDDNAYVLGWEDMIQDQTTLSDFMDAIYGNEYCAYDAALKNSPFDIPDLEPLLESVTEYVKAHQGQKGFILTDDKELDPIYDIEYCPHENQVIERHVKAVRVDENGALGIIADNHDIDYKEEDVADAGEDLWHHVADDDIVYFIPTLFNIAENIPEYRDTTEETK